MSYIEYKEKLEFSLDNYKVIDRHCANVGIKWSTSFWDIPTLEKMTRRYHFDWIKIPSAHLTSDALIKVAAQWALDNDKYILISTGMSTEEQIDHTFDIVESILGDRTSSLLCLMHCNSTYPTPINEINLECINTIREKYGCLVGYSGHETTIITSAATVLYDVFCIEKHITLDRNGGGTDDWCSLEPVGVHKWVRGIKDLESALIGDGELKLYDSELSFRKKLRGE